jgi:hypothetical protein
MRSTLLCGFVLFACGSPPVQPPDAGNPPPDAGQAPAPFTADAPPSSGLHLTGDVSGTSDVTVSVVSSAQTALFGVAFHVTVPSGLQVQNAAAMPALGSTAVTLVKQGSDLAFGISQPDPVTGNGALSDNAVLARFTLHAPASLVAGRVELTQVVARTADGHFVPLGTSGAAVSLGGTP